MPNSKQVVLNKDVISLDKTMPERNTAGLSRLQEQQSQQANPAVEIQARRVISQSAMKHGGGNTTATPKTNNKLLSNERLERVQKAKQFDQ